MATLGDILGAAKRSASNIERWLNQAEPDLAQMVSQAALDAGVSLAGYARIAVANFSRYAEEDDWASLTRLLRESDDPGTACLTFMLRWSVAVFAAGKVSGMRQ